MSNKIYPQKDISKIVFKKRLKLLLLVNAKKENKLVKKIERKRRQIGREVICKSWVFSLSVLKILLTNFPWFDVEKWFSWFLCLYVYFSFHFFLSFFFWKHTNCSFRSGVTLKSMKRGRIRKQVTLCCFQSNVSSLQWLQLHQLLLLQYHSQRLRPCQLYQRTAWIVSSFQSTNKRCISISWIERTLDSKTWTTTRPRFSQCLVVHTRDVASFWRENAIAIAVILRVLAKISS